MVNTTRRRFDVCGSAEGGSGRGGGRLKDVVGSGEVRLIFRWAYVGWVCRFVYG